MAIVGEAYEVGRRELIRDARTAWTWHAELTVSYLTALQRVRTWNLPDRGW
jgi:hypothetical protein